MAQQASVTSGGAGPDPLDEVPRHFIVVNWFEELRERMGGN